MGLYDFLILLLVAGICGSIGQAIVGYSRGGCGASIGLGFIGALLGTWIARQFGLRSFFTTSIGGTSIPIDWTILGSVVFVAVIAALTRGRRDD